MPPCPLQSDPADLTAGRWGARYLNYWFDPFLLALFLLPSFLSASSWESFTSALAAPFTQPTATAWTATLTAADSDEDALYTLHHTWWRDFAPRSRFAYGWEVSAGLADSGKYDRSGAVAGFDYLLKSRLLRTPAGSLDLLALAGFQLATIDFPGGSPHNFRLGAAFEWVFLQPSLTLRAGYLHLSNANLASGNEGLDALWFGLGLRL